MIQKLTEKSLEIRDFKEKNLLIVDDDAPLRDRLARAMQKRVLKLLKLRV